MGCGLSWLVASWCRLIATVGIGCRHLGTAPGVASSVATIAGRGLAQVGVGGGYWRIARRVAWVRGPSPRRLLGVKGDEVGVPAVEDRDVHAGVVIGVGHAGHRGRGEAGGVAAVRAGGVVDCSHNTGQTGLADTVDHIAKIVLGHLVCPLVCLVLLITVSVGDVGLEVPAAEVSPPTAIVPVPEISTR